MPELAHPCPDKTRGDLEWDRLLEALADRCVYASGKRAARALAFATSPEAIATALAEAREASALDAAAEPLPLLGFGDVEDAIDRARIGATLSNEEIRAVAACLGAARALRRFLQSRRATVPALYRACATDPALDDLERELSGAFDPDGTLSDRASPHLGELRAERRASRDRLVRRLDELIRKHEGILQDRFWTERDGRYVLPVRADAHERFPGIVHAASDSGATLFVEPRAVVPMGNRQKMLDGQVAREEQAVYVALSAKVAEHVDGLAATADALTHADLRAATSKLAKELRLTFPELLPAGDATIDLVAARHPLLELDGVAVVASDLAVGARRAMVVSGPNAGGKTVALKTLGLAALMVRAGLPVPAADGSRVSPVDLVLTDVGDDQNLRKNLSTFSAHVQNLAAILDATHPGVLVLLDELAGGTDPREGEALAVAVLDSLCARGGAVACTTHYDGLKALALGDPRFQNASVGFDLATMSPTFKLAIGVPGSSSALAVARRFGVPGTVLERAERFLSRESVSFDKMVERLDDERRALELARADAEREAAAARARQAELERERERLVAKERGAITREGEALLASLRRAREDLGAAQARLRKGKLDEGEVRGAGRVLDHIAQKVAIGGELEPAPSHAAVERRPLAAGELRVGAKVWVPRLRAEAEIVEMLPGGQLRVAAGPLKLLTSATELRGLEPKGDPLSRSLEPKRDPLSRSLEPKRDPLSRSLEPKGDPLSRSLEPKRDPLSRSLEPRPRAPAAAPRERSAELEVAIQTSDNTVDLRGLRSDEAVSMAEQFLDRSLGAGRRVAYLVHGHGSGALREAVRDALRHSSYVAHMSSAEPREGGDGVTVVWLR